MRWKIKLNRFPASVSQCYNEMSTVMKFVLWNKWEHSCFSYLKKKRGKKRYNTEKVGESKMAKTCVSSMLCWTVTYVHDWDRNKCTEDKPGQRYLCATLKVALSEMKFSRQDLFW